MWLGCAITWKVLHGYITPFWNPCTGKFPSRSKNLISNQKQNGGHCASRHLSWALAEFTPWALFNEIYLNLWWTTDMWISKDWIYNAGMDLCYIVKWNFNLLSWTVLDFCWNHWPITIRCLHSVTPFIMMSVAPEPTRHAREIYPEVLLSWQHGKYKM